MLQPDSAPGHDFSCAQTSASSASSAKEEIPIVAMTTLSDHAQFESLAEAFAYLLREYGCAMEHQRRFPAFLFRGECGEYDTTTASAKRLRDSTQLSKVFGVNYKIR